MAATRRLLRVVAVHCLRCDAGGAGCLRRLAAAARAASVRGVLNGCVAVLNIGVKLLTFAVVIVRWAAARVIDPRKLQTSLLPSTATAYPAVAACGILHPLILEHTHAQGDAECCTFIRL